MLGRTLTALTPRVKVGCEDVTIRASTEERPSSRAIPMEGSAQVPPVVWLAVQEIGEGVAVRIRELAPHLGSGQRDQIVGVDGIEAN